MLYSKIVCIYVVWFYAGQVLTMTHLVFVAVCMSCLQMHEKFQNLCRKIDFFMHL